MSTGAKLKSRNRLKHGRMCRVCIHTLSKHHVPVLLPGGMCPTCHTVDNRPRMTERQWLGLEEYKHGNDQDH